MYKIGINHDDLDTIAAQLLGLTEPDSSPPDYPVQLKLGNGKIKNMGWLFVEWHWNAMTEAQFTALRGFIGDVNIITPDADGVFVEYSGNLNFPEKEPDHASEKVLDVTITIIQMIPV